MSPAERRARRPLALRFARSELAMVIRRRRNLVLLAVFAAVPLGIAVAVRVRNGGHGGGILGSIAANGLFAPFAALLVAGPLFLPLVVCVVAGDAVAGEASAGTLRYLLAVPVGRTRLLAVKFGGIVAWCAAGVGAVVVVGVVGVVAGAVLFPSGRLTLLSGRSVAYLDGLQRLVLAGAYVALGAVTVGALGLFVSTCTEVPVAAMAATLTVVVVSEVAEAVPQLGAVHDWLPTHYWLRWVDLLREPVFADGMTRGVLVAVCYSAFFLAMAWARFGGKDITS